jgi:pimeloyl-ACP methyl ester carboxylesterase
MTEILTRPLILIRGFGGPDISSEQASPYQGFNDGTVYPTKRGENYIYEGFLLRALKSLDYPYRDATNVIGYYASDQGAPDNMAGYPPEVVTGTVVIDPVTAGRALVEGVDGTMWVYRYYDLTPRALERYGTGLVRLIELIERVAARHDQSYRGVDIVAHSMGGLVVRAALRQLESAEPGSAERRINRIVTLGTPHRGIAFQRMPDWLLRILPNVDKAADELDSFDPTKDTFLQTGDWFPLHRLLTVVGTNYRTYGTRIASLGNRWSSLLDGNGLEYNRSDGLVKQSSAQLPGAPRTFIHKCHGGADSLITSREAYEIAMRFLHGTHIVRLWLDDARIKRGKDLFGKSEFYFGVSIRPRSCDFDLFRQAAEAENCYGPFATLDMSDQLPSLIEQLRKPLAKHGDDTTGWAGDDRLIWQGWLDAKAKSSDELVGLVFRLDVYLGERDSHGFGFSDNVVFHKQYYVQAVPEPKLAVFVHTGEQYLGTKHPTSLEQLHKLATDNPADEVQLCQPTGQPGEFRFKVTDTGFDATFRFRVEPDRN